MKLVKILVVLVLLIVVILGIGVGALFMYIDNIAKAGVERGATYALDVPTTLGSADVGVLGGTFKMNGLNVANPEGFDTPHFLDLGEGRVAVSLGTLRKEVVELPELALSNIDVNLQKADGKSNYKIILENLKRLESGEPTKPDSSKESGKEFIIKRIEIRNINAHVQLLPLGGDLTKVDVNVPEIVLTDVGKGGVPMSQLVNILTQAIMESIVKMGGGLIPADMLGDLQGQLGQLSGLGDIGVEIFDGSGKVVEKFGKAAEDLTKNAKEAADEALEDVKGDAQDALKGILGGGKDKKK